jgi:hypothetical protein
MKHFTKKGTLMESELTFNSLRFTIGTLTQDGHETECVQIKPIIEDVIFGLDLATLHARKIMQHLSSEWKANVVEDNIYTMSAYVTSPSPINFGILKGIIDRIINGWK